MLVKAGNLFDPLVNMKPKSRVGMYSMSKQYVQLSAHIFHSDIKYLRPLGAFPGTYIAQIIQCKEKVKGSPIATT